MKNFFYCTFIILLISVVFYVMGYFVVGEIMRHPNVIIKENSEYLWVKEYTIYNEDSCVHKYHQPIIYEGVVMRRSSRFQGVQRKGGHRVYRTHIKYNGDKEYIETGFRYYNQHEEGTKVKVKVTFYPWKKVETLN